MWTRWQRRLPGPWRSMAELSNEVMKGCVVEVSQSVKKDIQGKRSGEDREV